MKQSATLDTSFWINAHRAGLLPHVLERFEIRCAKAVASELSEAFQGGRDFWRLVREGMIVEQSPVEDYVGRFGTGERGAISLAVEHEDWVLLIDDRRALEHATRMGLKVLCSPAFVVRLYEEGAVEAGQAARLLSQLTAQQTVSPTLLLAAAEQLERIRRLREEA